MHVYQRGRLHDVSPQTTADATGEYQRASAPLGAVAVRVRSYASAAEQAAADADGTKHNAAIRTELDDRDGSEGLEDQRVANRAARAVARAAVKAARDAQLAAQES